MRTGLLLAVFLAILIQYGHSENPGYVMDIKLPVINKVRDRYFDEVFKSFGHQDIPEVKSGKLKVYDIQVDLTNSSPKNLVVGFDEPKNGLTVKVDNTYVSVKAKFRYKKSFVVFKGSIDLHGDLKSIGLDLGFDALKESDYYIPQIRMNSFDLDMPKSNFKFKLHCKGCPGFLQDLISKFAKDPLIDTIRKEIKKNMPSELVKAGNKALVDSYPRTVDLYNNIDICTAMTGPIVIKSQYIQFPIDGTLFLKEQGYHRTGSAPNIPIYNPKDPGEMMMFFSSYIPSGLKEMLNTQTQQYKVKYEGQTFIMELNPDKGHTELTFEEGDFMIRFSPVITMPEVDIGMYFSASAKIAPVIAHGDDKNMLYITPKLVQVRLDNFELIVDGSSYDLSKYTTTLNDVIEELLNLVIVPTIPVPKFYEVALELSKSLLDFHKDYTEFGMTFDFTSDEDEIDEAQQPVASVQEMVEDAMKQPFI